MSTRITVSMLLPLQMCAGKAHAHREDHIDETPVFETLEQGEVEAEYWFDSGRNDDVDFWRDNASGFARIFQSSWQAATAW